MRLTRKRAPAPEALSLGQPPRKDGLAHSGALTDHVKALETLEDTMLGVNAIEQALSEARELVAEAQRSQANGKRALLAGRLSFLRQHIDELAKARTGSLSLIDGGRDALELTLDKDGRERLIITHFNLTAGRGGLGLSQIKGRFAQAAEIERLSKELDGARARVQAVAEVLRKSAARLADRIERAAELSPAQSAKDSPLGTPRKSRPKEKPPRP